MHRARTTVVSLAWLLCSAVATAADSGYEYFSTLTGPVFPARQLSGDRSGIAASVLYGRSFGGHIGGELEATGSILETGHDSGTDFYQKSLKANVVFDFAPDRGNERTFFLLGGVGAVHDDFYPDSRDGWGAIADVGLGLVSRPMFGRNLHLRLEARYVRDFREGGHAEPRIAFGIEIPLHESQMSVPPPRPAAVVTPETQRTVVREIVRDVVREVPRPWRDADGDNVDDEHDRCPDTPAGLKADAFGCVIPTQRLELTGVTFFTNSAELREESRHALDAVVPSLRSLGDVRIEVAGHTDSVGSVDANARLSTARAESVRRYLVSQGLVQARVIARGYGESDPLVSPEKSDADRQRNRRVELRLTSTGDAR